MPKKSTTTTTDTWEVKDRKYIQKGKKATSFILNTAHSRYNPLQFKEPGKPPRSIRYCTNQDSIFIDEQEGDAILGRAVFVNGELVVKSDNPELQKLLSIYHPLKGVLYEEFDPVAIATKEIDHIKTENKAINYVLESKPNEIMAVGLSVLGSRVKTLTVEETRSDLIMQAKQDPNGIVELFEDEDVELLYIAYQAIDNGIIKLSSNNRDLINGKNIIAKVGISQTPQEALKDHLLTEEGNTLLSYLKSKTK